MFAGASSSQQVQLIVQNEVQLSQAHVSGWEIAVGLFARQEDYSENGINRSKVSFSISLRRKYLRHVFTIMMPAFFLNRIGFSTFWLGGYGDSMLVGPLAFLGLMSLHGSEDKVNSAGLTYFDLFYLVSVSFHFVAFVMAMQDGAWGADPTAEKDPSRTLLHRRWLTISASANNKGNNNNNTVEWVRIDSFLGHDTWLSTPQTALFSFFFGTKSKTTR